MTTSVGFATLANPHDRSQRRPSHARVYAPDPVLNLSNAWMPFRGGERSGQAADGAAGWTGGSERDAGAIRGREAGPEEPDIVLREVISRLRGQDLLPLRSSYPIGRPGPGLGT
jgi:hypothetical protein